MSDIDNEWNPMGYHLPLLKCFAAKFDNDDDFVEEVKEYILEFNKLDGSLIVAFRSGTDADDFVNSKVTLIFYTNEV